MANFKISLLTAVSEDNTSGFIAVPICNYTSQERSHKSIAGDSFKHTGTDVSDINPVNAEINSYCYTYNEKFSSHQNAQKDLSFSMDRKLLQHDEWITNPYTAAIHVGSLIELEDKYGNSYLFIVNKIDFKFKEFNITYNYTCKDAFSYQYTRQQSGFTIENDSSSDDFIGPKTIDWWVINKIKEGCHVEYEYVPINQGLYQDKLGIMHVFTEAERASWDSSTIRTIIKEPFTSIDLDGNDEYQTTIIFSCSNSNANAALISLGENLDLMLHSYESRNTSNEILQYNKYFWFEPKKNQDVSGLSYSPKTNISNFSLNFAGDNLTTILNVNSNESGDDLVTLIPTVPAVFNTLFQSAEWDASTFYPGYFNSLAYGKKYYNIEDADTSFNLIYVKSTPIIITSDDQSYVALQIQNSRKDTTFSMPSIYNRFKAYCDTKYTTFDIQGSSLDEVNFDSQFNTLYLIIKPDDTDKYLVFAPDEEISSSVLGTATTAYIAYRSAATTVPTLNDIQIYFTLYRTFTEAEKEFADIADTCPWLENRLIDFSYFVNQKIISHQEYATLLYKLQNDLRIANGKLLYFSDAYYAALKTKVKLMSELEANLDSLGAAFEADLVTPMLKGQEINNVNSFNSAYQTTFNINQKPLAVLNYGDLLSETFNDYLNAEQRFLKNIYAFRNYFETPSVFNYDENAGIYQNTITATVSLDTTEKNLISFGKVNFKSLTADTTENSWIVRKTNGGYEDNVIVNSTNYSDYYEPLIAQDTIVDLSSDALDNYSFDYCSHNKYLLTLVNYKTIFNREYDRTPYIGSDETKYAVLSATELQQMLLSTDEYSGKYYYRDTEKYVPFDCVRINPDTLMKTLSWISLPNILKYTDEEFNEKSEYNTQTWGSLAIKKFGWNYYTAFFPLSEIYYLGPKISYTTTTGADTKKKTWTFHRYDANGNINDSTDYEEYQRMSFIGNGLLLKDWGPCTNDAAIEEKEKLATSWKYYSLSYAPQSYQIAAEFSVAALIPVWGSIIAGVSAIAHACLADSWCQWTNNAKAYRTFDSDLLGEWDQDKTRHPRTKAVQMTYSWSTENIKYDDTTLTKNRWRRDSFFANYVVSDMSAESYHSEICAWAEQINKGISGTWIGDNQEWFQKHNEITTNYSLTSTLDLYQYFNFYKYVAATYSFRGSSTTSTDYTTASNHLWVKNKYLRVLKSSDYLNKTDTYIRIPLYENNSGSTYSMLDGELFSYDPDDCTIKQTNQYQYVLVNSVLATPEWKQSHFSRLTWYPLYQLGENFNISSLDYITDDKVTLNDLLAATKAQGMIGTLEYKIDDLGQVFLQATNNDQQSCAYYLYCHVEDYERAILSNAATGYIDPDNYTVDPLSLDTLSTVYDLTTDLSVNLLKFKGCLSYIKTFKDCALLMVSSTNDNLVPATSCEDTKYYYKKVDNQYVRVYTLTQLTNTISGAADTQYCTLAAAKEYCYLDEFSTQQTTFSSTTKTFDLLCYLTTFTYAKGKWTIESKEYTGTTSTEVTFNDTATSYTLTLTQNNKTYTSVLTWSQEKIGSLNGINNGTFWYLYHTRTEWPGVFEHAAAIETQLQTYWDQAYTASKYCRFFLPQYWQPNEGSVVNHFVSDILIPNATSTAVTLSTKYIPNVAIYNNPLLADQKYKHYLPKYTWTYSSSAQSVETKRLLDKYNLSGENALYAGDVEVLQNPGIRQVLSHLNTDYDHWLVVENGYTVYYYYVSGGMQWSEAAHEWFSASNFDKYDGWYAMKYYLLTQCYIDRPIEEYLAAKDKRDNIWKKIYNEYPFILLEGNYSYANATNSSELLKMAQLVFKGMKEPEKGYTVSLIDTNSLAGYRGQQLFPGQGILLKDEEYYDENDDIASALKQYLFITDVSYTLRSDASISITVNAIKYQEKMLQSLVKLIR